VPLEEMILSSVPLFPLWGTRALKLIKLNESSPPELPPPDFRNRKLQITLIPIILSSNPPRSH